jgi:hypothetical protein
MTLSATQKPEQVGGFKRESTVSLSFQRHRRHTPSVPYIEQLLVSASAAVILSVLQRFNISVSPFSISRDSACPN